MTEETQSGQPTPDNGAEPSATDQIAPGVQPADEAPKDEATPDPAPSAGEGDDKPAEPAKPADAWGDADEELRTFIGDKTPAQVAKELQNAQKLIGKKSIGIPGKDATPDEVAAYHKARGVPDTGEAYDFGSIRDEALKDFPEAEREQHWDKDEEARFRAIAKAANLSQGEASELLRRELSHRIEDGKKAADAAAEVSREIRGMIAEKWGAQTEQFTKDADRAARHVGLDGEAIDALTQIKGVGAEARFKVLSALQQIGMRLSEGGQPGEHLGAPSSAGMTASQATAAKAEFLARGDNEAAYLDATHPNHKAVTDQVTKYLMIERGKGA